MTRKLKKADKMYITALGQRVKRIILQERRYSSLDAFSLEYHDEIAKGTLYDLCDGKRDLKLSTLLGLCRALDITLDELTKDL